MGSVGDCYDNAKCVSFFATLECELIDHAVFQARHTTRFEVLDFIQGFYNPWRLDSSTGYVSPVVFEARWATTEQSQWNEMTSK